MPDKQNRAKKEHSTLEGHHLDLTIADLRRMKEKAWEPHQFLWDLHPPPGPGPEGIEFVADADEVAGRAAARFRSAIGSLSNSNSLALLSGPVMESQSAADGLFVSAGDEAIAGC